MSLPTYRDDAAISSVRPSKREQAGAPSRAPLREDKRRDCFVPRSDRGTRHDERQQRIHGGHGVRSSLVTKRVRVSDSMDKARCRHVYAGPRASGQRRRGALRSYSAIFLVATKALLRSSNPRWSALVTNDDLTPSLTRTPSWRVPSARRRPRRGCCRSLSVRRQITH